MSRRSKGEGTIYETIEKHKRRKFLPKICNICSNCSKKCDRTNFEKCEKCRNCKSCIKYCDRYYAYYKYEAQITVNGSQISVGRSKTKAKAIQQKKENEAKILTNSYIKNNDIFLLPLIEKIDEEKLNSGLIKQSTVGRNKYQYKKLENSLLNQKPIQKITYQDIQNFLDTQRNYSQSEINKIVHKLNNAFTRAVLEKIISYADNPMLRIQKPISLKQTSDVEAFEIQEEIDLLKHCAISDIIVKSSKSNYDNNTIRNLIVISLLSLARIGELGALDYNKHIDWNRKQLIIERTLTEDTDEKVIIGNETKTGKYQKKRNEKDIRYVPFGIFDEEIMIYFLKSQFKIAKENKYNKNNLLFCQKNGKPIVHTAITAQFKRICREIGLKTNLTKGCHIHMTRHTGVTRLIEFGTDLSIIASLAGHTTNTQIEETYGHILQQFRNYQIENPGKYFKKTDLITPELKKALLNTYNI